MLQSIRSGMTRARLAVLLSFRRRPFCRGRQRTDGGDLDTRRFYFRSFGVAEIWFSRTFCCAHRLRQCQSLLTPRIGRTIKHWPRRGSKGPSLPWGVAMANRDLLPKLNAMIPLRFTRPSMIHAAGSCVAHIAHDEDSDSGLVLRCHIEYPASGPDDTESDGSEESVTLNLVNRFL